MTKPHNYEDMDARDWIILRLLLAMEPAQRRTPEFSRVVLWASENLDVWNKALQRDVEQLKDEAKANLAMYHEALQLWFQKNLDLEACPLVACMAIDSGEDQ